MLYERLRKLLAFYDINISYFAKRIGVSKAYAGLLVNGKSDKPKEQLYNRIASEFHVNLDWLMFGIGDMFEGDPAMTRAAAFIEAYYELTEAQKDALCLFLQQARHHRLYLQLMEQKAGSDEHIDTRSD